MKFKFTLTGVTPILLHNDNIEAADKLSEWRQQPDNKKNSKAGDDRSPAWSWMTYLYTEDTKPTNVVLPAENLARCLVLAGTQITLKKQKTMKEVAASGLFIHDMFMPITGPKGVVKMADIDKLQDLPFSEQAAKAKELGFSLFVKRAAVGQSKHVRVRPRFDQWSVTGIIEITVKEIEETHLNQMFEIGGTYKGLCDWRPGGKTPGPFGKFTHTLKKI